MLGRGERESGVHTRLAAQAAGWEVDGPELLVLGSTSAMLGAVATLADLSAVVHIGHPAQPVQKLEHTLLSGPRPLFISGAVATPSTWTIAAATPGPRSTVVLDETALRDCRNALEVLGFTPHLVPTGTSVERRIAIAGAEAAVVLEQERVPEGFVELAGPEKLGIEGPIWYGLVEAHEGLPTFAGEHQIWLAVGPPEDYRGSLRDTLGILTDAGINLQHIRSATNASGPHVFFSSFLCDDSEQLVRLHDALDAKRIRHRVLAAIALNGATPSPVQTHPVWP